MATMMGGVMAIGRWEKGRRRGSTLCMFSRAGARELPRRPSEAARGSLRGGGVHFPMLSRRRLSGSFYGPLNDLLYA